MGPLLTYAIICVAPAGAFLALEQALKWYVRPDRAVAARPAPPRPTGPSLERLVEDLRRLEAEYRRIERSEQAARAHRMRAVSLAYDDTLCECCRALGLPPPSRCPLSSWDRVQAEVELARHGLTW